MFKIQEIREIIKLIDASSIDEFVYEAEGSKVKLKKNVRGVTESVSPEIVVQPTVVQQSVTPVTKSVKTPEQVEAIPAQKDLISEEANLHKITSPMVGTFYQSPNPESPVFIKVGDKVGEESIVCIVEAMKLFNEIEAEVTGEILEILVKDGQLVEYGQPLYLVKVD